MPTYHLPIYPRPETGVYCLHTSIAGKQFKKSLHTKDKAEAIIRAIELMAQLASKRADMSIRKFEIDLKNQIFKSDGTEQDNNALIRAIQALRMPSTDDVEGMAVLPPSRHQKAPQALKTSLTIREVLDKFLLLKKFEVRTVQQYTANIEEFALFVRNKEIQQVLISDITAYQEHLIVEKKNSHRTANNKTTVLRTFFNFAIDKGYFFNKNPCENQQILTKKQLEKSTYSIFTVEEISTLFSNELFTREKIRDADFYFACLITLITGLRAGEITTLKKGNVLTVDNITYIKLLEAKTTAGIREIPLPDCPLTNEFLEFVKQSKQPENKIFKYKERDGKGAGNALGKKFGRLLKESHIHREKLVFHSLRKFFNDYLKKNGIQWEMRSQVVGHETDDVNNNIYSNQFTIDEVAEAIEPLQVKILFMCML